MCVCVFVPSVAVSAELFSTCIRIRVCHASMSSLPNANDAWAPRRGGEVLDVGAVSAEFDMMRGMHSPVILLLTRNLLGAVAGDHGSILGIRAGSGASGGGLLPHPCAATAPQPVELRCRRGALGSKCHSGIWQFP